MITYKYEDALANYNYTTGGSSHCTNNSTQVVQQSKIRDLFWKNSDILKPKKYEGV